MSMSMQRIVVICGIASVFPSAAPCMQQARVAVPRRNIETLERIGPRSPLVRVSPSGSERLSATSEVALRNDEFLVKSVGARPVLDSSGPTRHYDLPTRIVARTTDQSLASLSIAVASSGLAFDPKAGEFVGVVLVGLDDSVHRTVRQQLTTPVIVQLHASDPNVKVEPSELQLDHTNVPFPAVRVSGRTTRGDTVFLTVRPTFQAGSQFVLPVSRPTLHITASPRSIAAFGFEKARLTVELSAVAPSDTYQITLAGRRSKTSLPSLTVAMNRPMYTDIPSSGTGFDTIEAHGMVFRDSQVVIQYVFPYLFIGLALLGGCVGAVARWLTSGEKGRPSGRRVSRGVVGGVLAGLLAAAGAAVGINLTPVSLPSPFSAAIGFVVAGIVAYAGIRIPTPGVSNDRDGDASAPSPEPAKAGVG
jgi:hypothetical protein